MQRTRTLAAIAALGLGTAAFARAETTVVTFDGGDNGGFAGNAFFEGSGGNPGGAAHHDGTFFFNSLRTGGLGEPANAAFLGDYSLFNEITISFDIRVDSLTDFAGNQITRPIGISLIDRDIQGPSGPSGVFFELDPISASAQDDWTTMSLTITDPTQMDLPPGWIGFGDEDPNTFEPILPSGASFASVLSSVDEFQITGGVPGFFFTNANFDVFIDNIAITVPAPATLALLAPMLFAGRRRR